MNSASPYAIHQIAPEFIYTVKVAPVAKQEKRNKENKTLQQIATL